MVQYHKNPKTKASGTGGKKRSTRDKVKAHYGRFFHRARIDKKEKEAAYTPRSTKGGNTKIAVKIVGFANVSTKGSAKVVKAKVLSVVESPNNRHYTREGLVTKGAVIETELGKCKVTSRPTQDGTVNAVLMQSKQ